MSRGTIWGSCLSTVLRRFNEDNEEPVLTYEREGGYFCICSCSVRKAEHVVESVAMRCVIMHFVGQAGRFFCDVLSCARPVGHRSATESKGEKGERRRAKESNGEQRRTKHNHHKQQEQNNIKNK